MQKWLPCLAPSPWLLCLSPMGVLGKGPAEGQHPESARTPSAAHTGPLWGPEPRD